MKKPLALSVLLRRQLPAPPGPPDTCCCSSAAFGLNKFGLLIFCLACFVLAFVPVLALVFAFALLVFGVVALLPPPPPLPAGSPALLVDVAALLLLQLASKLDDDERDKFDVGFCCCCSGLLPLVAAILCLCSQHAALALPLERSGSIHSCRSAINVAEST